MKLLGIALLLSLPIFLLMWIVGLILTVRYKRKLKIEYPEELKTRGGLRYLNGYLKRREYKEFGNDEFVQESEALRIFTKIWFIVFFTTMAIGITFFITRGMS
jgi:hypothetical protein